MGHVGYKHEEKHGQHDGGGRDEHDKSYCAAALPGIFIIALPTNLYAAPDTYPRRPAEAEKLPPTCRTTPQGNGGLLRKALRMGLTPGPGSGDESARIKPLAAQGLRGTIGLEAGIICGIVS